MFSVEEVSSALARQAHRAGPFSVPDRRAAVGIILAGPAGGLNICMIRRAVWESDVWSGHIALPGGRAQAGETSAAQVVERETYEEVGLQLGLSPGVGSLPDVAIRLAGRDQELILSSMVYFIGENPPPLQTSEEVAEAFWVSVAELWDPSNSASLRLNSDRDVLMYPAIRIHTGIVWGVTLRILALFSDVIGHPLPHFEEIPGLRM